MKKLLSFMFILCLLMPSQAFASSSIADAVIDSAKQQLGKPYKYGAAVGDLTGFDCSSFSSYVFSLHGISLPRVSMDQAKTGIEVSRSNLKRGDLLFYDTNGDGQINHLGIYISANEMIHSSSSAGVHLTNPFTTYWSPRFVTARRVITEQRQTPIQSETIYSVKSGDTMFKIAKEYGITVDALKSHNRLTSDWIYIGQQLRIPPGSTLTQQVLTGDVHTVKAGDTLWLISRQYNSTVQDLMTWNELTTTSIQVGQNLKVRAITNANLYTVQSGDTLWRIAVANGTTVQAISEMNQLTSTTLFVGQALQLP
ncbi:LysM peptidoglycan-binding domain-containing protein [Halalkalibacter urbisdiaboli]|uniref:LysM peptidoglycan-binding domain-containing protein n=1 Tax=Halalkalibacter urbisdiaboli TaxID=1960589 RepID=UPI000B444C80|nr:LysM peptidoglycan-binding domain-containing protein [Halalkalibacter urbisdiaboli]